MDDHLQLRQKHYIVGSTLIVNSIQSQALLHMLHRLGNPSISGNDEPGMGNPGMGSPHNQNEGLKAAVQQTEAGQSQEVDELRLAGDSAW
jgi:hypothetical protein